MLNRKNPLIAIETVRNLVLSAKFMVLFSVAFTAGVLVLLKLVPEQPSALQAFSSDSSWWRVKLLCLLVVLLIALITSCVTLHFLYRVLAIFSLPENHAVRLATSGNVVSLLHRADRSFEISLRMLFFATPLTFWLFGPGFLILSCAGVVAVLFYIDRSSL